MFTRDENKKADPTACGVCRKNATAELEFESGGDRVLEETLDGIERYVLGRDAEELLRLQQDVIGHGDDLAAAFLGLAEVVDLARARPEQFRLRQILQKACAREGEWNRIRARVSQPAAENRDHRGDRGIERRRGAGDLFHGEQRG